MPVLLLLAILLGAPSVAAAQPRTTQLAQHAYELGKVSPAALRGLQKALPAMVKTVPWIHQLKGVAGLMVSATIAGRPYLGGQVCKPHDCADNKFAYLVTRDGTRAVGRIKSDTVRGASELLIGDPTPNERAVLATLW